MRVGDARQIGRPRPCVQLGEHAIIERRLLQLARFPVPVVLPAYWLANLSAKVAFSERFTLVARMENLFDEDYELASGFNTMGRSVFGALRYEFR